MTVDRAISLQIINTQYSVFFGVIFSFFFYVNPSNPPSVELAILNSNYPVIIFMVLYYFTDWFTVNILPSRIITSVWILFLHVLGIAILGVTIVLMNKNGMLKYILFGGYGVLVGIYDLWLLWSLSSQCIHTPGISNLPFGIVIASIRVALSLIILVTATIGAFRPDVAQLLSMLKIVIVLVLLKFARLIFLNRQLPLTQEPTHDGHDSICGACRSKHSH